MFLECVPTYFFILCHSSLEPIFKRTLGPCLKCQAARISEQSDETNENNPIISNADNLNLLKMLSRLFLKPREAFKIRRHLANHT